MGFKTGQSSTCVFKHLDRNLKLVVHGDDFTILGEVKHLEWFKSEVAKRWEYKHKARLGPGDNDDESVRILKRIVEWMGSVMKQTRGMLK